jgi:uncharacterized damage-inducible protein DinB
MPAQPPPVADERSALVAYLVQQQDAFRGAVYGLTDEQAGLAPTPSVLSVGALLKHVTSVQEGWLSSVLAAPEFPVDDRPDEERYAARERAFTWFDTDSVTEALKEYDDVSERVLDGVRTVELDRPVPVPPAPWNPKDVEAWSARWVWFHLIEELARHAGHADIVREAIDGATMYELIAGREGWDETPWLKPWRLHS